jgi:hypothetical protein
MSAAARSLHLTQPTVSLQIKKLNDLQQFMAEHLHECIRPDWVADSVVQLASAGAREIQEPMKSR